MIAGFIVVYKFNIKEFLDWGMRYQAIGIKKSLMAYPSMISQLCLATGVQEIPRVDKMIKATNITDHGLIRDIENSMAKKARRVVNMVADMLWKSDQAETVKAIETGKQTDTTQTDATGTSGAPPLVQFVAPRPQDMPSRLGILEPKVHNMKGGMKPWVDTQMASQD